MMRAALLAAVGALSLTAPALAQLGPIASGDSGPVAIDAVSGIEWDRDGKRYIARGDAKAVRGGVTVYADTLIARYRDAAEAAAAAAKQGTAPKHPPKPAAANPNGEAASSGGGTDIWRIEAIGKVRIVTATETATGDKAVYDVDQDVLQLTGHNLRLVTQTQTVTARDSLEYWQGRQIAVARGDAVAFEKDRRIQADSLTAHMGQDAQTKGSRINKVDGFGHVRVSTEKEVATGDKGVYDLVTNIAVLVGDVKVTQGKNQLNGDYSQINMTTGIAKMMSGAQAGGHAGGRVRALLSPEEGKPPEAGAPTGDAAGAADKPAKDKNKNKTPKPAKPKPDASAQPQAGAPQR